MNRNLAVGLFVLVGLTLFTTGLFMIGNRHEALAKHLVVYTDFVNLSGLSKGSKVQVSGMDAGQVQEIRIPDSPSSKFRLKIQIDEKLHGLVRSDSIATITTEGVVGDTFVAILPGSAAVPAIQAGGVLQSREPTELADLLNQAKGTIADVDVAVRNANGLLSSVGGNLNTTLTTAQRTLTDVDVVVDGVKRGEGAAGVLLRDPKVADAVRQTISNTQQATKSLQDTSMQADALLTDIRSRNFPQKVDDTLISVRDATSKIDSASAGVQETIAQLTAPDDQGNSAGTNLREAISRANSAAGNMAEGTEAVKHNVLLRGFFRHRGYYSLTGIAPATYRKDPVFTSARDSRSWLDAGRLFVRKADGKEELTSDGKLLVDQTLDQYGNSLEGAPLMVEGYAGAGSMADRIEVSRERALAVRNYIRDRYHLDAVSLGSIGLSNVPPSGSDHATWDGICVVLVRSAH